MAQSRLRIARIVAAHGVRGVVKVKVFTEDPADLAAYGTPVDAGGRDLGLTIVGETAKGHLLARLDDVQDRTAAEALRGTDLYVDRDALPAPEEDEFYYSDLEGVQAELDDGTVLGRVRAVHDFGAGDVLEIQRPGAKAVMVPFTRAVVPEVDLAGGRVVIHPCPGLLDDDTPDGEGRS